MRYVFALLLLGAIAVAPSAQCRIVGSPGGSGCGLATPFGIPTIACAGAPRIGNQAFAVSADVPFCHSVPAAVLMVGACRATPLVIRGPFGNGAFCGPAEAVCALFLEASPIVLAPGVPRPGGFVFALAVPNDPALRGVTMCTQEANLCVVQNVTCVGASHGIAITIQ